jgi:hypothetical protein
MFTTLLIFIKENVIFSQTGQLLGSSLVNTGCCSAVLLFVLLGGTAETCSHQWSIAWEGGGVAVVFLPNLGQGSSTLEGGVLLV